MIKRKNMSFEVTNPLTNERRLFGIHEVVPL